ncbi:MAG: hypothetical protein WBF88_17715 [Pusillimonas sp.]
MIITKVWLLIAFASGIHGTPNTLAHLSSQKACETTKAEIHQQLGRTYNRFICVPAELKEREPQ